MSYRLNVYRASWFPVRDLGDGWYGGPEIIVKGSIPERYGYPGNFAASFGADYIACATPHFGGAEPVSLGEPERRPDTYAALTGGAWIRPVSEHPGIYIDADLATLAETATGCNAWRMAQFDRSATDPDSGDSGPVLMLGESEPVAFVAPVRPACLQPDAQAVAA
jgi:hypothetical protein